MISMMLWTALSLSAATAHGAVVPRQAGDFDLAGVILQSSQVQRHLTSTKRFMGKEFPYSEGPMEASKAALGDKFKDDYDHFEASERKCLYIRNSFIKEATQSFFDVVPNVDAPDTITEDEEETGSVTESKAIVDTQRIGWNKEESTETGGSVTAGVQSGISAFSVSLSATIYGNQRTTGGQYGEASKQTEYTVTETKNWKCPKNSICRHVTWTYTRTLKGKCITTPYYDAQCANSKHSKAKFSLALFGKCTPSVRAGDQFYTYSDNAFGDFDGDLNTKIPGYGPDNQGIKMPKPEVIASHKFADDECSFTYVLRDKSGSPVRARGNLIEKESSPLSAQVKVTKVPKALKWIKGPDDQTMCELEGGWYWMPGNQWYISPKDGNTANEWARRAELPDPVDLEKNCPANGQAKSKRALPPANKLSAVPANDLVQIDITQDDMPAFLAELEQSQSEGFVANTIDDKAQPVRREGWGYPPGRNFEHCLDQNIKQNGKA
ncbi:hypothetical protein VB005_01363 [Metarhizium brunneum]